MNSIDIANGIIFQKMNIRKTTFDERIICQKKIYLLESLGTDMGYSYNWYIKGPYSPGLANYVYSNIDILSEMDFNSYKVSDTVEKNIHIVNGFNESKPKEITESSWYELLASLVYIDKNRESWKVNKGKDNLFSELIKHKSQFKTEQCEQAYEVLKNNLLVHEDA